MNQEQTPWKWRYSGWVGLVYGPIPVGIILVVVAAGIYLATRK